MTVYATFNFYQTTYKGISVISAPEFDRLILRSSAVLDRLTFNRANPIFTAGTDANTINLISFAVCAIVDQMFHKIETLTTGKVSSERVGNVSTSYFESPESNTPAMRLYNDAADLYLFDTGLMYKGVYSED